MRQFEVTMKVRINAPDMSSAIELVEGSFNVGAEGLETVSMIEASL